MLRNWAALRWSFFSLNAVSMSPNSSLVCSLPAIPRRATAGRSPGVKAGARCAMTASVAALACISSAGEANRRPSPDFNACVGAFHCWIVWLNSCARIVLPRGDSGAIVVAAEDDVMAAECVGVSAERRSRLGSLFVGMDPDGLVEVEPPKR